MNLLKSLFLTIAVLTTSFAGQTAAYAMCCVIDGRGVCGRACMLVAPSTDNPTNEEFTIQSRSCTNDQLKRGCFDDTYECNRPTHYQCHRCTCPFANEDQVSNADLQFLENQEPTPNTCCKKYICREVPRVGLQCFSRTVCGDACHK